MLLGSRPVDGVSKTFAGFEVGNALSFDHHGLAGSRIPAFPGISLANREGAKASQLDTSAALKGSDDLVENGRDDFIDISSRELGVLVCDLLNKL